MNKNLIAIIVAVLALGAGGGIIALSGRDNSMSSNNGSATNGSTTMDEQSSRATPQSDEVMSGTVEADIKDFAFMPETLKVKKGTTITWTNQDSARHNVFSEDEGGPQGELLAKGESYSFTFDTVGTFSYICEPHPYMKGTVEVTE